MACRPQQSLTSSLPADMRYWEEMKDFSSLEIETLDAVDDLLSGHFALTVSKRGLFIPLGSSPTICNYSEDRRGVSKDCLEFCGVSSQSTFRVVPPGPQRYPF